MRATCVPTAVQSTGTVLEAEGAEEGEDAAKEALWGKQVGFTQQEKLEDMTCVRDALPTDR
ncbi:MAG: hypothetical protein E6I91_01680 [Chloroflexi bacterium]|nr:MAG: hypothetical protein E6I91_01680 [Chloroflexota bacterium]